MIASKIVKLWPTKPNSKAYQDFISCLNCHYITIRGGGTIDGRGYHWWLICILNDQKLLPSQGARPHLILLSQNTNLIIRDIVMKNSPQFHLKLDDCYDAELFNINIKVNTTAQLNLLKKAPLVGIIPLFPLNTDGIDPSGARMYFHNISVQNFDDVVVPKPSHEGRWGGNCTQDMLV